MQTVRLSHIALVLLSMVVFGLNPIFAHYLVEDINPLLVGGFSLFIASLPLFLQILLSGKVKRFYQGTFLGSLIFVVLFSTIGDILFFVGTKLTSGINTALLLQIEPIYATILAALILGEIIRIRHIFAILTIILGAGIVVYKGTAALNLGDILIVLSPLFYQFSHLNAKKILTKVSKTNLVPATRLFFGGIIMMLLVAFISPVAFYDLLSPIKLLSIIAFGLYLSLDFFLWYQVLKRLPLSVASGFLPFSVFVSVFGAMLFLREQVLFSQYIGLILIVAGLFWLSFIHVGKTKKPS